MPQFDAEDRIFFLEHYHAWRAEQHAHLIEHEGSRFPSLTNNYPPGAACPICRYNWERIDDWQRALVGQHE